MKKVVQLPVKNHFGDCPQCGGNDGYINIGRDHWFVCRRHGVKWYVGTDIFPGWRNENAEEWRLNAILLSHYLEVEPFKHDMEPAYRSCRDVQGKAKVFRLHKTRAAG